MKKISFITALILSLMVLSAQDAETVKEYKISQRVEKEILYEDGLLNKRILKEQFFDDSGRLVEFKDWTKDGKIKEWVRYTYNADGLLLTEEVLNPKGKIDEKVVFEYQNGLKVKKSYYDNKQRLVKEKFYEYSYYK